MNKATEESTCNNVVLHSDNGSELLFSGYIYSESSHFYEETGTLVRLRLFITEAKALVYSFVFTTGLEKQKYHYTVKKEGDLCRLSDGIQTIMLPVEMLHNAVFSLCVVSAEEAEELRPVLDESLHLAAMA